MTTIVFILYLIYMIILIIFDITTNEILHNLFPKFPLERK